MPYGIVTVCDAVATLVPHGLVAARLKVYEPAPTVRLVSRAVVARLPANDPLTFRTYPVGAAPAAGGSQMT